MQIINFPTDIDGKTEERIRAAMQEDAKQPEVVKKARTRAYEQVHEMARENGVPGTPRRFRRRRWQSFLSAAAVAAVFSIACIANPAFAAKIPLVGHVFETLGNSLGFSGDFEKYAVGLDSDAADGTVSGATDDTVTAEGMDSGESASQLDGGSYSKADNGMTVTLSEMYCNEKTLYLSMLLTTEEPFPETLQDEDGGQTIELCDGSMNFSYNPEEQSLFEELEGRMLDEHTYAGVLRVDLNESLLSAAGGADSAEIGASEISAAATNADSAEIAAGGDSEEAGAGTESLAEGAISYEAISLPDEFTFGLQIRQIAGDLPESSLPAIPDELKAEYEQAMQDAGLDPSEEAYAAFTEEEKDVEHELFKDMMQKYYALYPTANTAPNEYENWWIDGDWSFTLDVTVDHSDTNVQRANTDGACDIGEITLTRTPFEIVLDYDYSRAADYFIVLVDADGKPLGFGKNGGSVNTLAIAGQDVSEVTLFVCGYDEYMDELKGYYYSDNYEEMAKEKTYAEYLGEHSIYSETVVF